MAAVGSQSQSQLGGVLTRRLRDQLRSIGLGDAIRDCDLARSTDYRADGGRQTQDLEQWGFKDGEQQKSRLDVQDDGGQIPERKNVSRNGQGSIGPCTAAFESCVRIVVPNTSNQDRQSDSRIPSTASAGRLFYSARRSQMIDDLS
jgi:hypothetical protein